MLRLIACCDAFSRNDIFFTIWDYWTILGHEDFTLSDFMNAVGVRHSFALFSRVLIFHLRSYFPSLKLTLYICCHIVGKVYD